MGKFFSTILGIITVAAIIIGCYIHFGGGSNEKATLNESYGANVVKIDIDAALMDIEFKEGTEFSVSYEGYKDLMPELIYSSDKKVLHIDQKDSKYKHHEYKDTNKMVIEMPKDCMLEQLELELALGNVTIDKISSEKIKIDASLGEVKMGKVVSADIDIEASLGDVKITSCDTKDLDIDAALGNVEVKMEGNLDDYAINADSAVGKIKIGNESHKKSFEKSGTAGKIEINCSLGNVDIL